jgi:hypothetical protein
MLVRHSPVAWFSGFALAGLGAALTGCAGESAPAKEPAPPPPAATAEPVEPVPAPTNEGAPAPTAAEPGPTAPEEGEASPAPGAGRLAFVACEEPRKTMCTREYRPVCGEVDTGVRCIKEPCPSTERKTYSNACEACADKKVVGYFAAACDAIESGKTP